MSRKFDSAVAIHRFIEEYHLIKPGERVLVAVSGGADSVFLLHILNQLARASNWSLFVGHVNHGLRGAESDEDERFVSSLAAELGLPFRCVRVNVQDAVHADGISLQEKARDLRYEAFESMAREWDLHIVATAHHANDQAETVLQRLLRGTSLQGLGGIEPKRSWPYKLPDSYSIQLIRPLLTVAREDIEEELGAGQVGFREDSSNMQVKYSRNKIRLHLLPLLTREYNPNIVDTLSKMAGILQDDHAFLEERARQAFEEVASCSTNQVLLDRLRFADLPIALQRRVIKLILYYLVDASYPWQFTHIEGVRDIALQENPHAQFYLPKGILVQREYEVIHISISAGLPDADCPASAEAVEIPVPGTANLDSLRIQVRTNVILLTPEERRQICSKGTRWTEWFDYDSLAGKPLYIRSRRPGDRLQPFGMAGSKKLKDLLIEAKLPIGQRDRQPVLVWEDTILWVVGIRRSNAFPITPATKYVLRVDVSAADSAAAAEE